MKYDKMLCLVNAQEKQIIKNENKNKIAISFTEDIQYFIRHVTEKTFPVVSVFKTDNIKNIIQTFQNIRFYLFFQDVGKVPLPDSTYDIFFEDNVVPNSKKRAVFTAAELFDLFEEKDIME
jgi:hypothetical protein